METGWGQEEKEKRTGMDECRQRLKAIILEKLDFSRETTDEEIKEMIDALIISESKKQLIGLPERNRLRQELFYAIRKLDILQELIDDSGVTEIMVNGTDGIFIERGGRVSAYGMGFASREKLEDVIQQIAAGCNRTVNEASPIVDARLENGSRVNVVLAPVALNGPILTIRRFPEHPIGMKELTAIGSVEEEYDGRENSICMSSAPLSVSIFSYIPYTEEEKKEIARKKAEKEKKEREEALERERQEKIDKLEKERQEKEAEIERALKEAEEAKERAEQMLKEVELVRKEEEKVLEEQKEAEAKKEKAAEKEKKTARETKEEAKKVEETKEAKKTKGAKEVKETKKANETERAKGTQKAKETKNTGMKKRQ